MYISSHAKPLNCSTWLDNLLRYRKKHVENR